MAKRKRRKFDPEYKAETSVRHWVKQDIVASDRTTVSKHLAVLRAHGIVEDRRDGNVAYYKLLTPCVVNFLSCASQVLKERA